MGTTVRANILQPERGKHKGKTVLTVQIQWLTVNQLLPIRKKI